MWLSVRLLIDSNLPPKLAHKLVDLGHDAIHVSDVFPGETEDFVIALYADQERRAVVSKDSDFRNMQIHGGVPTTVLEITTGNINNSDLMQLIECSHDLIERALASAPYVELSRHQLIAYRSDG